jgi:hypothetical protein
VPASTPRKNELDADRLLYTKKPSKTPTATARTVIIAAGLVTGNNVKARTKFVCADSKCRWSPTIQSGALPSTPRKKACDAVRLLHSKNASRTAATTENMAIGPPGMLIGNGMSHVGAVVKPLRIRPRHLKFQPALSTTPNGHAAIRRAAAPSVPARDRTIYEWRELGEGERNQNQHPSSLPRRCRRPTR